MNLSDTHVVKHLQLNLIELRYMKNVYEQERRILEFALNFNTANADNTQNCLRACHRDLAALDWIIPAVEVASFN